MASEASEASKTETYLVHLDSDGGTSRDGALAAGAAGADIATDASSAHVGDGGVGARETGALGAEVDAVNPELLEGGVSSGVPGQSGQGGEGEGLHGCEVT
jgi:hypothetical protein